MSALQDEIRHRIMTATSVCLEACDAIRDECSKLDVDKIDTEDLMVVMARGMENTAANLLQTGQTIKMANLRLAVASGDATMQDALKEMLGGDDDDGE